MGRFFFYFFNRPILLAAGYMFFASISSILLAIQIDSLFEPRHLVCGESKFIIHPFLRNISTVIDFVLLNPLIIYLLQKTILSIQEANSNLPRKFKISGYHQFGIFILSIMSSFWFMKLYISGNLAIEQFDSNIFPDENGVPYITLSGWVVFFWTWLFIAFLINRSAIYSFFVVFVLNIKICEIKYIPFHTDEVGGMKPIIQPCIEFAYAMVFLLLIFVLFMIQDYIIDRSTETLRLLGFVLYIILSIPLFYIPLIHIHNLMKEKKACYSDGVTLWIEKLIGPDIQKAFPKKNLTTEKCDEFVQVLEVVEKYNKIISNFPTWPLSKLKILPPVSSFIGALLPITIKLFMAAFKLVVD